MMLIIVGIVINRSSYLTPWLVINALSMIVMFYSGLHKLNELFEMPPCEIRKRYALAEDIRDLFGLLLGRSYIYYIIYNIYQDIVKNKDEARMNLIFYLLTQFGFVFRFLTRASYEWSAADLQLSNKFSEFESSINHAIEITEKYKHIKIYNVFFELFLARKFKGIKCTKLQSDRKSPRIISSAKTQNIGQIIGILRTNRFCAINQSYTLTYHLKFLEYLLQ